jgi:surface polysaccharide O-acyltransferase-like enzyme
MSDAENFSLLILLILVLLISPWRRFFFFPRRETLAVRSEGRSDFFDFAKGLSIIAVIIIHAAYFYYKDKGEGTSLLVDLINNLCRFAIPVFFISSGVLLKPWDELIDQAGFYKRKLLRIFLPYALIVSLMAVYYQAEPLIYLKLLLNGRALVPYYFVIVLAQLYLLYPLISNYRKEKYFLLVTFCLSYSFTLLFPIANIGGAELFFKYLFFFAYGIHLRERFLSSAVLEKGEIRMWWLLSLFYFILIFVAPKIYYNSRYFYGLAIFNILYYYRDTFKGRSAQVYKTISHIGVYSLWIFFLHFFIEAVFYRLLSDYLYAVIPLFLALTSVTLLLSYFSARACAYVYSKFIGAFSL